MRVFVVILIFAMAGACERPGANRVVEPRAEEPQPESTEAMPHAEALDGQPQETTEASEAQEAEAAAVVAQRPPAMEGPGDFAKHLWQTLGTRTYRCDDFDYGVDGGIRTFYCYMKSKTTYADIQRLAGVPIFLSGPHDAELTLNRSDSFGHYNPAFVEKLNELAIPAAEDEAFRQTTQPLYDRYVRPLARIMWATREKLKENEAFYRAEAQRLQRNMNAKNGLDEFYYEDYFFFMNPEFIKRRKNTDYFFQHGFDAGFNGNVTKSAVGFWLRRKLDGTDQLFEEGLRRLLGAYDAEFIRTHTTPRK